jgi:hypothetical protein
MSLRVVVRVFVFLAALVTGSMFLEVQAQHNPTASARQKMTPASAEGATEAQRRAEELSEERAIDADCAALRKMGATNKNCPPPSH